MNDNSDKASQIKKQDKNDSKTEKVKEKRVFKGLCMNCEHRFTCTLPRPETGVWYCEEYE